MVVVNQTAARGIFSVIDNLVRLISSFGRDRDGNIAVIFTLALIPLIGFIGASVDYSRAASLRTALQSALDATALMVSKNAATQTATQVQTAAQTFFNATFDRPESNNTQIIATYSSSGGSAITISGSSNMKTDFMKVMGFPNLPVKSTSTVQWGNTRLRVAIVLDTTGSMASDGKMAAMQSATKNLLTQLQSAATTNGDVYVSIVPFSKSINVGADNYNATWIDWTDWESEPANIKTTKPSNWSSIGPGDSCPFTSSTNGYKCAPSPTSASTTSSIPSSGTYSGYICPSTDTGGDDSTKNGLIYNGCYNSVYNAKTVDSGSGASCSGYSDCTCSGSGKNKVCKQDAWDHNWIKNAHSTWNGCVTDRGTSSGPSNDYDRLTTAPGSTTPAKMFPAEQYSLCSAELKELSYDWTGMKSMVDGFSPNGSTNQPIGLVWGWQTLVGGGPIATPPVESTGYQYSKVIILMSDGLNTLNRWYGDGSSTSTSVDKRMYDTNGTGTCANIKATGITIYTLQVNTGGDPTSTLLKNCASSSDKTFVVTTASGIGTVFTQIGTQLSNLHISN